MGGGEGGGGIRRKGEVRERDELKKVGERDELKNKSGSIEGEQSVLCPFLSSFSLYAARFSTPRRQLTNASC